MSFFNFSQQLSMNAVFDHFQHLLQLSRGAKSRFTGDPSNFFLRNSSPALMRYSKSAWKLLGVKLLLLGSLSECPCRGMFCIPIIMTTSNKDLRYSLFSVFSSMTWGLLSTASPFLLSLISLVVASLLSSVGSLWESAEKNNNICANSVIILHSGIHVNKYNVSKSFIN